MARTSPTSVTFASALHSRAEDIDRLLSAIKAAEERLSTEVDETEKALLEQERERIWEELKRILLQAHRRAHPLDIAGMVQVAVARSEAVVASPPAQRLPPERPPSFDVSATPTREAILADIQALTLKFERGARERGKAGENIKVIVTTWFDAHYGADDPRLVKACIPFVDHLPKGKRFSAFRKRVHAAIPTTELVEAAEEPIVIPADWPWHPYFTGKRLAVVGGLETGHLRRAIESNLAPLAITWFETDGPENSRVRGSLFEQMQNGAFDLIIVTRFASRKFALLVLSEARRLQVPAFRVTNGSNMTQIRRAAEKDLPRPKAN